MISDRLVETAPLTEEPAQFDAYAGSYDDAVNQSLAFTGLQVDYFTRVKTSYLLQLLDSHFGGTGKLRLLDVGCGVGNYHMPIGQRVGALAGVDVSADCLAAAAR